MVVDFTVKPQFNHQELVTRFLGLASSLVR